MNNPRLKIVGLARRFYKNEISFEEFLKGAPEQGQDELIDELVDLIEHEPQKGGIFGVSKKEYEKYIMNIFHIIERLENESA